MAMPDRTLARESLRRAEAAFVLVKDGRILATEKGQGVQPLWDFLSNNSEKVQGATLADKIVGRAVAFLAVTFGLVCVFGTILSEGARDILVQRGLCWDAQNIVPVILNRTGDGPCPVEKGLRTILEPEKAIDFLVKNGFFHRT
jgi:hypothetical protein